MSQFEFYYFTGCPFCHRVMDSVSLQAMGVKMKNIMENMDYRNELMLGGGSTQVPCLKITNDDQVEWMYESADIIRYFNNLKLA